jgi:signal transduction histidine kinase/CheY-like chemotaxis protein
MVGIRTGCNRLALLIAFAGAPLAGQTPLRLQEVGARDPSAEYRPVHLNQRVTVRGVVNSPAFHFPDHTLLAIDDGNFGAVIRVERADDRLDPFHPGDDIQVDGIVSAFAGMPVVAPDRLSRLSVQPAPAPVEVPLDDLIGFRHLGRLVRTTARTETVGDTANGAYVSVAASDRFMVFIPRTANQTTLLKGLSTGNTLQITGVAYQYCARPPFNRYFQLLVQDPAYLVPVPRRWFPPATALGAAIGVVLLILFFVWSRERRVRKQRERLRNTYHLGEEILGATTASYIVKRLREALPPILKITGAQIWLHNRAAGTLDSVAPEGERAASFQVSGAAGEPSPAVVWCFQYNAPLTIPDPAKSPFQVAEPGAPIPKSLLFVPMFAQGEVVGVLQLDRHDGARDFTEGDQELAQHLANQAAVAVRLADQRSVQEQLFRTEKLAAVGRLITGVVDELRTPLESIGDLASRALAGAHPGVPERDLSAIAAHAARASSIVSRLVSYASAEPGAARPVQVGALLRRLIEFREGDWKATGIRVRDLTTREPLGVLGSEGQLEQVFLNLLVHAEQALAESSHKLITIRTSVLARRVLVEIAFTGGHVSRNPSETASVLGVTRSVVGGHGGEIRLIERGDADPRFEVELPLTAREWPNSAPVRSSGPRGSLTALVIENDESAQRHMLGLLSARGVRVVPVDNADTGLDLAHRMRFDIAFCAVHAPGLNWVELSESLHSRVAAFVLISDRHDPELSADFEGRGRFVIPKPVQEPDLEHILELLDPPIESAKNIVA